MERKNIKAERKERRNEDLCALIKENGYDSKTRLLRENEGLIFMIAKNLEIMHEIDLNHYGGIELDDIIQEGRLAMLEAADRFDESSGTRFSTYAYTVMKNAMNDLCRKADSSFERQLADNGITHVFLDDHPVDEDGTPVCEMISDGRAHDPVGDKAVLNVMIMKMHNRLKSLPVREQKIISYHYGIDDVEFKTPGETAMYFHLSEKYLKIIEKKAFRELRAKLNDGEII